jgi:hypothetical protein
MKSHTRRAIAYIAGRLATGGTASHIYDYSESKHVNFSGSVSDSAVSVYDYEQCCHITGSARSVYHYGDGHHISLRVNGNSISGYDYGTGSHFSARVSGRSLHLYDYEGSSNYQYLF